MVKVVSIGAAVILCNSAEADFQYRLDDGVPGSAVIGPNPGFGVVFMNQFDIEPNFGVVTSIEATFRRFGQDIPATEVVAGLWVDPDGDGDPIDALLVATSETLIVQQSSGTEYEFGFADPVDVSTMSGSFFAGVFYQSPAAGNTYFAIGNPISPASSGRSWMTFFDNAPDPTDFADRELWTRSTVWTIRANAVPGPATAWIACASLFAATRRRR